MGFFEALDNVDNPLHRFAGALASSWTRMFGSRNDRLIREILPKVAQINALEDETSKLSDAEIRERIETIREQIQESLVERGAPALDEESFRLRMDGRPEEADEIDKKYQKIEQSVLDGVLVDTFALIREAGKRTLGQRHYDVQLIGGIALHNGWIAEMVTGEGKTLVATLGASINALAGRGVHVVTVNDYLARRDAEFNRPLFEMLGLSVGIIQSNMSNSDRRVQYACDITYGTNNEFGFDYLRDNMKVDPDQQAQQSRRHYSIVDEVDSILIDEARTPLIISGDASDVSENFVIANEVAKKLRGVSKPKLEEEAKRKQVDKEELEENFEFVFSEKDHQVILTENGIERVEKLLGRGNIYDTASNPWPHHIEQALRAHNLYKRDKQYVVQDNEVIIVDEHTGRLMHGRNWSDGLHQAVEAKEGVRIKKETQTLATITLQNYFRLYDKLSGMTGTALTEAGEFWSTYKLEVLSVPTNRPLRRTYFGDVIYRSAREKYKAICAEIEAVRALGRPVLVGTISVENSERLSQMLQRRGIEHEVLNAKQHLREASIVAEAGQMGRVTVATNMAGRGTDIMLGTFTHDGLLDHWKESGIAPKDLKVDDPEIYTKLLTHWKSFLLTTGVSLYEEWTFRGMLDHFDHTVTFEGKEHVVPRLCTTVQELGGLHIVGSERHDSRRIDNQLRGRCGRQGDPGSSRFYLSLEDDLMRIFASDKVSWLLDKLGMEEGQEISAPMVTRSIEKAQKKVEAHHFDIRKNVLEYDQVMDEQRKLVYRERQRILEGKELRAGVFLWIERALNCSLGEYVDGRLPVEEQNVAGFCDWNRKQFGFRVLPREIEELSEQGKFDMLFEKIEEAYTLREQEIGEDDMRRLERFIMLQKIDGKWKDHLHGMDQLRSGIGWHGYAQQDPKIAYKREGYKLFQEMWENTAEEITGLLFKVRPVREEEEKQLANTWQPKSYSKASAPAGPTAQSVEQGFQSQAASRARDMQAAGGEGPQVPERREAPKVKRNAPCPCGSGKKYKKCCGRTQPV